MALPRRGADDAQLDMPDRQPFLDQHPDHVAGGKTGSIADDIQRIVQVAQHRADCHDKDRRLEKAQHPGDAFAPAHHHQHPQRVQGHIADA